ncbi:MAG: YceD family protein [Pseudoxanthomonas sp.]
MSANLPENLDVWRMVAARRSFEGRVPLSSLTRLDGLLVDSDGDVEYALQFDRDVLQVSYVELKITAQLPLECQRSLQRFLFPVSMTQRLGLIRDEAEEVALPPGYEALLVPEDGMLRPLDLVEDELVLAVPAVPLDPDMPVVDQEWSPQAEEAEQASPFAALASLKHKN